VTFAATAPIPEFWTCRCGQPAGLDKGNPPEPEQFASLRFPAGQKSHLAYVRQRRSQADGEALIEWALARLHARREHQRRHRDQAARVTRQNVHILDIHVLGPVASATLPAIVSEPVAVPSCVARWQPRRRSRAQRQRSSRNSNPGSVRLGGSLRGASVRA
jgi:RNA polymerase-binding protein